MPVTTMSDLLADDADSADSAEAARRLRHLLIDGGADTSAVDAVLPVLVATLAPRLDRMSGILSAGLLTPAYAYQFDSLSFDAAHPNATPKECAVARRAHAEAVRAHVRRYWTLTMRTDWMEEGP